MVSSVTSLTTDGSQDNLTTLREGDEAVNLMTGEVVTRYRGEVSYLVPTGRGPGESQLKIDISRLVEGLIDGNILPPGAWILLPNKHNRIGPDESLLHTY